MFKVIHRSPSQRASKAEGIPLHDVSRNLKVYPWGPNTLDPIHFVQHTRYFRTPFNSTVLKKKWGVANWFLLDVHFNVSVLRFILYYMDIISVRAFEEFIKIPTVCVPVNCIAISSKSDVSSNCILRSLFCDPLLFMAFVLTCLQMKSFVHHKHTRFASQQWCVLEKTRSWALNKHSTSCTQTNYRVTIVNVLERKTVIKQGVILLLRTVHLTVKQTSFQWSPLVLRFLIHDPEFTTDKTCDIFCREEKVLLLTMKPFWKSHCLITLW